MYACVLLVLPHLSHPKTRWGTSVLSTPDSPQSPDHELGAVLLSLPWVRAGEGSWVRAGGAWARYVREQWQQLEQGCHCFGGTSTGPKNAPQVWIGAKGRYCLLENALFWQSVMISAFLYCTWGFFYRCVRTPEGFCTLHTSGNNGTVLAVYHCFVLTFTWRHTIQRQQIYIELYHTAMQECQWSKLINWTMLAPRFLN